MLPTLPLDIQVKICTRGRSIPVLASTCTALQPLGQNEECWREAFAASFAPVLTRWLNGKLPSHYEHLTWRERYMHFEREWMSTVFSATGTVLVRLHSQVYDITDFVDHHPGGPILLAEDMRKGCIALDVGAAFDTVGHSSAAKQELSRMLVPPPPGCSSWPSPSTCECPSITFAVVDLREKSALLLKGIQQLFHLSTWQDGLKHSIERVLSRHAAASKQEAHQPEGRMRAVLSSGARGFCMLRHTMPVLVYLGLLAVAQIAALWILRWRWPSCSVLRAAYSRASLG